VAGNAARKLFVVFDEESGEPHFRELKPARRVAAAG
jgi:hypothetical protein